MSTVHARAGYCPRQVRSVAPVNSRRDFLKGAGLVAAAAAVPQVAAPLAVMRRPAPKQIALNALAERVNQLSDSIRPPEST